jgi:hypothetical protein
VETTPARTRPPVTTLVVIFIALLIGGTTLATFIGGNEKVCRPGPGAIRVVAESSHSGLALAQVSAPEVAPEVAEAASESCASLSAAVSSGTPEADLKLREEELTPAKREAPDRTPQLRKLRKRADEVLRVQLLDPLGRAKKTHGSPIYGIILAIAQHVRAARAPAGCNIVLSDGIAIERMLGGVIDMRRPQSRPEEQAALRELVRRLRPLRGGTVAILGAGGDPDIQTDRLLRAQQVFETTMKQAGITPVWSRSTDLPKECRP